MAAFVGIDTISLGAKAGRVRTPGDGSFKSLLGAAVFVNDYDKFKIDYDNAIDRTLISLMMQREKKIYCNYDFKKLYNITRRPVHEIFFSNISRHIDGLYIFFTAFRRSSQMRVYGHIEKQLQHKLSKDTLKFEEIIDALDPYFALIGLLRNRWRFKTEASKIFIDGQTAKPFDGWDKIRYLPFEVLFSGDKCNPLIATADILAYFITLRSKKLYRMNREGEKSRYRPENFPNMLPELQGKITSDVVNERAFKDISPLSGTNVDMNNKLWHPIVFLLKDQSQHLTTEVAEALPGFDAVYDFAYDVGAAVKFFNKDEDKGRIKAGDYIVYFTDDGKRAANTMKGIMPDITIMEFKSIAKRKAKA